MGDFNLKKYLAENKLLIEQEEKDKQSYSSINAIMADLEDKLPQFKTVDTAPEFLSLMNGIIDLVISQSSDFIESGRFIQAMVQLYNQRKDIQKKASTSSGEGEKDELKKLGAVLRDLVDRGITSTADARKAGLRLSSAQKKALAGLNESKNPLKTLEEEKD
jgi:hypothetical protein